MFLIEETKRAVKFSKGQDQRQDINRNYVKNPQIQGLISACCGTAFHGAPDQPAAFYPLIVNSRYIGTYTCHSKQTVQNSS